MPLTEIRRADILRVMEQVAEFSGPSNSNKVHTLLVMMLNSAVERELVQSNVALGIRKLFRLQPRDRVLSDAELKTLWQTLEVGAKGKASDGHGFHPTTARALQVCLLTGQRRQEIADMKWSEIDLPGKLWTLPRERSKNRKAHTVPLSLPVCEILQAARATAPKSSWVFPTPIGSHSDKTTGEDPIPGMALRTALARFAAEHDWPALGPHDLRRTMATRMAEEPLLGSSDVIGWILNHAPQGVTRQVYVRANYLPQARTLMQAWADVLATQPSTSRP
jgi:integrase